MTDEDPTTRPEGLTGVLDAIASAVANARAMPMSSSVLVNRAELLDLVDQARDVLPSQLSRADEVLADADTARSAAQAEADALVDSEAVVVAARERAQQIVREAEESATVLRRDADDYCDRRLADFEIDLGKVLSQVQAGRAKLAGRLGADES